MQGEAILSETIEGIQQIMGAELDRITVERAVVGLFFTGVKLDSGGAGACATPLRSIPRSGLLPLLRRFRHGDVVSRPAARASLRGRC
jgi:hypothetical protein